MLNRQRLVTQIESPYQAQVTTIVAGAGFGKSVLAWQWARQTAKCVCWISLDPVDDDVTRFVDKLIAAGDLEAIDSGRPLDAVEIRQQASMPIDMLIARMQRIEQDICVIVDNCHVLADAHCIKILNEVIVRLPAHVSVILIGRRVLPVRLSRLRSQGQVRDITASDLRFTKTEALAAVEIQSESPISPVELDRMWLLTEGWIAGIKLTALALATQANSDLFGDDKYAAVERFLDEYILEEIIEPLPGELRELVLALTDLPFVTPGLCATMLDLTDGHRILSRLVREVPFLVPDDASEHRYRYSPLFAESLRRLVGNVSGEGGMVSRQLLAAKWFLDQGDMATAAELALRSNDSQLMIHVFNVVCRHYADRSDLGTLMLWLERLPWDVLTRNLNMPYWWIVARLGLGRTASIGDLIDEVEPRWMTSGDPLHAGRAFLCRGMLAFHNGDEIESERRLSNALERLPQDAHIERLYATTCLDRLAQRRGHDEVAATVLGKAGTYAARLPFEEQWSWRVLAPDRANTYALRGDLSSAMTKFG